MKNRGVRLISMSGAFVILLSSAFVSAQESRQRQVDAEELLGEAHVVEAIRLLEIWLDAERDFNRLPGISVGVVYDQSMAWSQGFGYSDLESEKPASSKTIYSICSISKLFTSIGVMQLRDQGKFGLDDPISMHIPWFEIQKTYPDTPPVTVRGILTHSSGLPRETGHPYWTGPDFPFPERQEIIERISGQSMLYPSNTFYQYSNLGLTLAGDLVIQISGQSYDSYIRQEILDPLGLSDTTSQIPVEQAGQRLATGYGILSREGRREKMPLFQARGIGPAAGYASTVEDLAKFASWQFRLLERGGQEILRAGTLREMQRVQWVDADWSAGSHRGLGFSVWRDDDKTFVGHGGSCPGYRTHLSLDTRGKVAAIFMSNAMGVNVRLYTRRIHQILGSALIEAAKSRTGGVITAKVVKKSQPELGLYTGLYRGFWGEAAAVVWNGELALLYLPTEDPLESLIKLKHASDHSFRRLRDDEDLGEEIRFELDEQGRAWRLWRHGNFMTRVD